MNISRRQLLSLALSGFILGINSAGMAKRRRIYHFTVDPEMQKEAQKLFSEAQALAKSLNRNLDGSDASIHVLESLLGQLYQEGEQGKQSKDTLKKQGRIFGFYYGEVVRRHHGGTWGTVMINAETVPALRYSENTANDPFFCCSQVENRLLYGKDFNVADRYFDIAKATTQGE